jgi:hypothetical protein
MAVCQWCKPLADLVVASSKNTLELASLLREEIRANPRRYTELGGYKPTAADRRRQAAIRRLMKAHAKPATRRRKA